MKKIDYKSYQRPSDFAKFPQGQSTIRIVSSGGIAKKHGMRTATGYVPLGNCTEDANCKFCLQDNEPKIKWMWLCIFRPDNQVKLLDCGPMIGDAICKIAQNLNKDPQEYDLVITKAGEGLRTKYNVKLGKETPLTAEEIEKMKAAKVLLIKKYFT